MYLLLLLTTTSSPSGASRNHRRAVRLYNPTKQTPLTLSPSILFMASRLTVRTPGMPQAHAWKSRAFFSIASLPHLGTAARNQVMVRMTHQTLPAMVKKYNTMKRRVQAWDREKMDRLSINIFIETVENQQKTSSQDFVTLLWEPWVTVEALNLPGLAALQDTLSSNRNPRKNTRDTIM